MKLQKLGGFAVLASICLYIVFVVNFMLIFSSANYNDPADAMAVMSTASGKYYALLLLWLLYILLSFFVVVVLHKRMHAHAPYLCRMMLMAALASAAIDITKTMVSIECILKMTPAQDLSAFSAYWTIQQGLKGAADFTFAWGFLFIGCAILVTRSFSRILGWLATLTGILLILVCCFPMDFGFKQIYAILLVILYLTSSIWLGVALLRQKQPVPHPM